MSVIQTFGSDGKPNGKLITIWHVDSCVPVSQVYLTTILPGKVKGPHLHHVRRGLFFCVSGKVRMVVRIYGKYMVFDPSQMPIPVGPGTPCAFYNLWDEEALILNMPHPPYRESQPDENPVTDWNPPKEMLVR